MSSSIVPRANAVLAVKEPVQEKSGDLYLPQTAQAGRLVRARIVRLSPDSFPSVPANQRPLAVDDVVLYLKDTDDITELGSDEVILPISAIVAKEEPPVSAAVPTARQRFFSVPNWNEFKSELPAEKVWTQWENIREFKVDIGFMEPFGPLDSLRRTIYEQAYAHVGPSVTDNLDPMDFDVEYKTSALTSSDETLTLLKCEDDYYDGAIFLAPQSRLLGFRKRDTRLRCLVESVPVWMNALHAILASPAFVTVAGTDYSRVLFVNIGFDQRIRLEGRGREEELVRNSELVGRQSVL